MKGPQPPADHVLPIGAAVVCPGTDVTVVSVSRMVHDARGARPSRRGISVEVIDLRTVAARHCTILESVATSRLLIAHEAVVPFGIGAEIAATVAATASGTRRPSSASARRRRRRPTRLTSNAWLPDATPSPTRSDASRSSDRSAAEGAITRC
jgi:hypothetical protein